MKNVSDNIERLIVRRLDGALTEDEGLQLDRELLRNPDARQLLEDYARVDAVASSALVEVLGCADGAVADAPADRRAADDVGGSRPAVRRATWARRGWRDRYHRGWWLVPGAIAAALLALVVPKPSLDDDLDTGGAARPNGSGQWVDHAPVSGVVPGLADSGAWDGSALSMPGSLGKVVRPGTLSPAVVAPRRDGSELMRNASHVPTVRRRTGREVIGVIGDDGSLYWIEVDRTRTIRPLPAPGRMTGLERL